MEAHLRAMDARGDLDNTAVVIFSDHGLHMGYLFALKVEQSVAENRLGLCHVILPRSMLDVGDTRAALQANTQKLVSSIDLHATFLHLAHWPHGPSEALKADLQLSPHARSLLGHIESSRTCADLGIPEDICICDAE